jgi:hypothetical protein
MVPRILSIGALHSTQDHAAIGYGELAPGAPVGRPLMVVLPVPGRYAIYGAEGAWHPPTDCRVITPDQAEQPASAVTIPVDYSNDGIGYFWTATFVASAAGSYVVTCQEARFGVADMPRVPGAVGALIHWPLLPIRLLAALPGLLVVAYTARRRARRQEPVLPTSH